MPRVLTASDLEDFRSRVCSAATELFAELGYEGFNMRKLAARLGVSAMTAYRYFDSKTDILAAVRARAFESLARRLEGVSLAPGGRLEPFAGVCRAYLDFAREEPMRYRLMFDLSQPQIARTAELVAAEQRVHEALAMHARLSGLSNGNPNRFAQLVWASLHGIVALTWMETYLESELDGLILETLRRLTVSGGTHRDVNFEQRTPKLSTERTGSEISGASFPLTAAE